MKHLWLFLPLIVILAGCAGKNSWAPSVPPNSSKDRLGQHHGQTMGGTDALKTDFKTLDQNSDGQVTVDEFKAYFPKVSKEGFGSLDLNLDGVLDRVEWLHFKKVHGVGRYPDNAV